MIDFPGVVPGTVPAARTGVDDPDSPDGPGLTAANVAAHFSRSTGITAFVAGGACYQIVFDPAAAVARARLLGTPPGAPAAGFYGDAAGAARGVVAWLTSQGCVAWCALLPPKAAAWCALMPLASAGAE